MEIKVTVDTSQIRGLGAAGAAAVRAGFGNIISEIEARAVPEVPVRTSSLVNSVSSFLSPAGLQGFLRASSKNAEGHDYASDVHYGTGLYGPRKQLIVITAKDTKPYQVTNKKGKQQTVYHGLFWPGAKHPVMAVVQKGIKGKPFFNIAIGETNIQAAFDEGVNTFLARRG